ncbi:hypothetical protein C1H76_2890 [Elsinoe australis]|uniref:Uncharacterized protein n=1 Tax=Elsinoe australis TaxID=40998 RepID=A0A4U7BAS4_9PEZI|nr:hypothetical protein C1H76_2890 [Elsinoe australis]
MEGGGFDPSKINNQPEYQEDDDKYKWERVTAEEWARAKIYAASKHHALSSGEVTPTGDRSPDLRLPAKPQGMMQDEQSGKPAQNERSRQRNLGATKPEFIAAVTAELDERKAQYAAAEQRYKAMGEGTVEFSQSEYDELERDLEFQIEAIRKVDNGLNQLRWMVGRSGEIERAIVVELDWLAYN